MYILHCFIRQFTFFGICSPSSFLGRFWLIVGRGDDDMDGTCAWYSASILTGHVRLPLTARRLIGHFGVGIWCGMIVYPETRPWLSYDISSGLNPIQWPIINSLLHQECIDRQLKGRLACMLFLQIEDASFWSQLSFMGSSCSKLKTCPHGIVIFSRISKNSMACDCSVPHYRTD
ncbi:hypothetical protein VTO42DRAFT_5989 [Malbranchea cinnamomea]